MGQNQRILLEGKGKKGEKIGSLEGEANEGDRKRRDWKICCEVLVSNENQGIRTLRMLFL